MTGLKGGTGNAIVPSPNFGAGPSCKASWNDKQKPLSQCYHESKYQEDDEWTAQSFDYRDGSRADRLEVDPMSPSSPHPAVSLQELLRPSDARSSMSTSTTSGHSHPPSRQVILEQPIRLGTLAR